MLFGKGKGKEAQAPIPVVPVTPATPQDPNAWMISNPIADFLLMSTFEIQCLCIFGYALVHGSKVFSAAGDSASISYKFVSLIFSCMGGGTIVPILINGLPTPIANDLYIICIILAFLVHHNAPIVREVLSLSGILKAGFVILYETTRASSVAKLTYMAADKIAPSLYSFPLMGPIFCGAIAGCGGAFLPFNKGLDPIKTTGLLPPMTTALIASTCFHLFMSSSYRQGVLHAKEKAQLNIAVFFIATGLLASLKELKKTSSASTAKKEN